MTNPSEEALDQANEADLVEQAQDMDGSGSVDEPTVAPGEADEADALEQGAEIAADEDEYPHGARDADQ